MSKSQHHDGEHEIPHDPSAILVDGPPTDDQRRQAERDDRYEQHRKADESYKSRQLGIDAWLAICTSLLVVLGLVGTLISWRASNAAQESANAATVNANAALNAAASAAYAAQRSTTIAKEAEKQTKLMRHQLVGTQAAKVSVKFILFSVPSTVLAAYLYNQGIFEGRDVKLKLTATPVSRSTGEKIGPPIFSEEWRESLVPHSENEVLYPGIKSRRFPLIGITPDAPRVVKIEGVFSYDNGFGDIITSPVCRYFMLSGTDLECSDSWMYWPESKTNK